MVIYVKATLPYVFAIVIIIIIFLRSNDNSRNRQI